jgi:uncharacterized protein (DUF1501 family)
MSLFGQGCLAARRMLEAGTRLVSVFWDEYGLAGDAWDTHWNHYPRMTDQLLPSFDRGFSGLVLDLEQRGMLDDTLVVWTTEFGRTPYNSVKDHKGREHHHQVFSSWMAGAGMKRGMVYGSSDEYGIAVAENMMHVHDFHATILHLLGIDHERLTYRYQGRDFRLTDVEGRVVNEILA